MYTNHPPFLLYLSPYCNPSTQLPWDCKLAGRVEQTGGYNFSIKGKKKKLNSSLPNQGSILSKKNSEFKQNSQISENFHRFSNCVPFKIFCRKFSVICTKIFCLEISQVFWKKWWVQNFQIFVRKFLIFLLVGLNPGAQLPLKTQWFELYQT